jgi:uncharacterized protein (TIGR02996 family)
MGCVSQVGAGSDPLEELSEQIISDPDNDMLRLSYARQLERADRERERAAFIRFQVALAKLPSVDHPDWFRFATAAHNLVVKTSAKWVPEWYASEKIREPQFHRGFIECVTVPAAVLMQPRTRQRLFASAPIRHLNIVGLAGDNDLKQLLSWFEPQERARLSSLNLDGQNLGNDSMRQLCIFGLKNLRWLSLANNKIDEAGVHILAEQSDWGALRSLEFVNLEGNLANPVDRPYEDQGVVVGHPSS